VHINETSSSRVDMMPYGGSKDSGFGREGPRYAIHEMTEERVVDDRNLVVGPNPAAKLGKTQQTRVLGPGFASTQLTPGESRRMRPSHR
jgi:hypothetical protein